MKSGQHEQGARTICLLFPFLFCIVILLGAYTRILLLPRYLVPAVPFALVVVLFFLRAVRLEKIAVYLLTASVLFFAANYNGRFYPANYDSFSVVERSHAYRSFNSVKVAAIEALQHKPDLRPAWVTREIGYMMSHPMMGYVDQLVSNIHPVYVEPWRSMPLGQFPDHFYLVKASVIHGGRTVDRVIDEASTGSGYEVKSEEFEKDGFSAILYEIRRTEVQ